ncbi:MAG: HAMP domain-containing histidine kinase [Christensenellaceae bacterium]|nr:HAMP domain-containing histidine kinase [Christensenellaceae bacterium]
MQNTAEDNRKNFLIGACLLLLGLICPAFLTVRTFRIYPLINQSLLNDENGLLVIAAFLLIILNSVRAVPIYLGTFLVGSSTIRNKWAFRLFAPVVIMLEYMLVSFLYDIRYDFGFVSMLVILVIYTLDSLNLYSVSTLKHGVVLVPMLISLQFIDVIPKLTPYGFGRGMVSMDVKNASLFVDRFKVLPTAAYAMMASFFFMSLLSAFLLRDQHKLLIAEQKLSASNIRELKERRNIEIRSLVHDLKSPMTTIQGLAGVISIISEDSKIKEYANRITQSGDNISEMIAQILDNRATHLVLLPELIHYAWAQIVSSEMRDCVFMEAIPEDTWVCINKVLFGRALVNLLNNAYAAIDHEIGNVWLRFKVKSGLVTISIQDDGCGISEENMQNIWKTGFSGHGSTGLGLSFVKDVVEDSGGTITIKSEEGQGTLVVICIQEVK